MIDHCTPYRAGMLQSHFMRMLDEIRVACGSESTNTWFATAPYIAGAQPPFVAGMPLMVRVPTPEHRDLVDAIVMRYLLTGE